MNRIGTLGRSLALAAATLVGSAATASAAPMLFTLEGEDYAELSASVLFTYTALNDTSGRVDIEVTNTSSAYDPRLTGFGFNTPEEVLSLSSYLVPTGWVADYDENGFNTPGNFGFFDAAALTGSNLNGGSPNYGIARGDTASFSFTFSGTGMTTLDEEAFLSLFSYDPPRGSTHDTQYFIGRFQRVGADGEGSDVALPGPPSSVPEPTTLLLSGLGLLGAAALRRRQRTH